MTEIGAELKKARARAERAEAEAALMRVALQSLRRRIDDIIQAATTEHRDLYWLDDGVTQMVKLDADAALASDAGRALLERVRKLERVAAVAARIAHGFEIGYYKPNTGNSVKRLHEALAELEAALGADS